ncbi:MAG: SsrA-binding protein [Candidatus Parcubacteria bacterium]|nr:MAG: SsrA-binding protein [Candidatus Parcubacteria bacterium]
MVNVNIKNPDIFRNYEILETYIAGVELYGFEVKSLFFNRGSLKGSYISFYKGEMFIKNFFIPPYQEKNIFISYDPYRPRKLLLLKKQIAYLYQQTREKNKTIIPLRVFNKNRLIKIEIALVKSLKKYEKRFKIKEREFKKQKERLLKNYFKSK